MTDIVASSFIMLNEDVPPVSIILAEPPVNPVVLSHARKVNIAVPYQSASGTNLIRFVLSSVRVPSSNLALADISVLTPV